MVSSKSSSFNDFLYFYQCGQPWGISTSRPQTEYHGSVGNIPASYLGGPGLQFSMKTNHPDYYFCSFHQFFLVNAKIVP